MNDHSMLYGVAFCEARKAAGITQDTIAARAGISQASVHKIEAATTIERSARVDVLRAANEALRMDDAPLSADARCDDVFRGSSTKSAIRSLWASSKIPRDATLRDLAALSWKEILDTARVGSTAALEIKHVLARASLEPRPSESAHPPATPRGRADSEWLEALIGAAFDARRHHIRDIDAVRRAAELPDRIDDATAGRAVLALLDAAAWAREHGMGFSIVTVAAAMTDVRRAGGATTPAKPNSPTEAA